MKFKARVELHFEADSVQDAMAIVMNMMEELQENHLNSATGEPWLEDWTSFEEPWVQEA